MDTSHRGSMECGGESLEATGRIALTANADRIAKVAGYVPPTAPAPPVPINLTLERNLRRLLREP